ncbi:hypothetical protein NQZ79_g2928 [Umbelopsis isabellina]|nr:hypothetical protein NQZ79_g2928 [Umbelopsis isabellina]
MAQEKPSTLLAAQVWVADQRSRWNDLASLHLADIDLLLDKQLKWVNDHSDIDTLLSTLTIWADPSNEHTVKKPVTAVDRQSISDFNEKHKFPPEEHNITSSHNQSSVHCIELPEHPNSLTSTASPKPIPIIPEPTHTSDEKSSLIDDNIFNVTKDVKIPQIANSLTTRTDDDIILPTREHSVLAESKEIGQPYVFNDDYNNELSVELIVNTLDNEPQSNHDTKSVDEDDLMVDIKKARKRRK